MRAAQIKNNSVVNIAEFQSEEDIFKGWIQCPHEVGVGWLYSDGEFSPPEDNQRIRTQDEINSEHRAFLRGTDWYVIRFQETGVEIPSDITEARQKARESIKR